MPHVMTATIDVRFPYIAVTDAAHQATNTEPDLRIACTRVESTGVPSCNQTNPSAR